ncbi:MAG TPA: M23 family metallopeptidase, partial [Chloroflexota bacterium]
PLTYLVQAGDTVGGIAESFGISEDTILSANDIDDPTALQIGAELTILPVSALVHTVAAGDTLAGIASEYGVSQESIASYNPLPDPEGLTVGDKLVVPGGRLKVARAATSSRGGARPSAPSGSFRWPTTGGISTYFSGAHRGIDIMSRTGVPIYAADGGTVVTAIKGAYDYGNYLVIDHGNGYRTLYAHLSAFSVEYGERVGKGENIGAVGSTGISTGPHLHFEVWENGVKVDPLGYLP